jgi:hypothetical protein
MKYVEKTIIPHGRRGPTMLRSTVISRQIEPRFLETVRTSNEVGIAVMVWFGVNLPYSPAIDLIEMIRIP